MLVFHCKQEKKVGDEPVQKFTPIIVTEKKIISLKKKASDGPSDQSQKPKTIGMARKMSAPSSSENVSESGSQSKAILRSSSAKKIRIDDDEFDEDALLADSPPSTPADATLKSRTNASKTGELPSTIFSNRRVVVRNADNATNNENNLTNKAESGTGAGKGIFDRLDKKVIGVNESAKRKIQRIVINK